MKLEAKNALRITFIFLLLTEALINTQIHAQSKDIELTAHCLDLSKYGLPSRNVRLLCKSRFLVGYSDETKTPLWTIERMSRLRVPVSNSRKTSFFGEDAEIPENFRATLQDYVGSGFDRGHLAAAGNYVDDPRAFQETFLLSNIAPQIGVGFNRGIWRLLEEEIRNLAQCTDELFVFTALVFPEAGVQRSTIGNSHINIPSAFIKILYLPEQQKAISFYAENRPHSSSNIASLLRSVDSIEKRSSYEFFTSLPIAVEKNIEARVPTSPWGIAQQHGRCEIQTN